MKIKFERLNWETHMYNNCRKGLDPLGKSTYPEATDVEARHRKIAYDTVDECPVGGSAWYLAKINREIAANNL